MTIKLKLEDIKDGMDTYFDVFYIIDLNTRKVLERIDEDLKELADRVEFWEGKEYELEVVRAMQWGDDRG